MSTTPDFGIPYIAASQAQPEVTHNEAISLLQALANGIIDRGVNTPPGGSPPPAQGDAYIVGTSPTGAWTGRENCIAVYFGTGWLFLPGNDSDGDPITMDGRQEGLRVWVRDEDAVYRWDGSDWVEFPAVIKNNLNASTDPTVNDDDTQGYSPLSIWFNTTTSPPEVFRCIDASTGAAVWIKTTLTIDELGTAALEDTGSAIGDVPVYEDDGDGNAVIEFPDDQAQQRAMGIREVLTADRDYYVRTDGNDSNSGLVDSAGGAFLTIQKALDTVAALDLNIFDATINVADGTYTDPVALRTLTGSGRCFLIGNEAAPADVLLDVTGDNVIAGVEITCSYEISGFKLQTTSGIGLRLQGNNAIARYHDIEFGSATVAQVAALTGAVVILIGNCSISAGANRHMWSSLKGVLQSAGGNVITITNTPDFSRAFIECDLVSVFSENALSFSGSATGTRYIVSDTSTINTGGGGATFFPGDAAGVVNDNGVYK